MSIVKNVVVEALATHPGFLKMKMLNDDGTVACETLLSVSMAHKVAKDIEDNNTIAKNLLANLQTLITKDALNGAFGGNLKEWAEKGGYNNV